MTMQPETSPTQVALRDAVRSFLGIVEAEGLAPEMRLKGLAPALDMLSLAYHTSDDGAEGPGEGEPPERDYNALREHVAAAFPALGFYPVASTDDDDEAEITMGDAIDDLTDIYAEILDVGWCLDHTSPEDAERLFRFGFTHHWGRHLCDVRGVLHHELFGI